MCKWVAGVVLLSVAVAVASADVSVRLTEVPRQIRLPLADGGNAILAARVTGEVRTVWLATGRDARARYLLDDASDGVYQVNLADSVLSAMLEAADAGQIRVFAEAPDGTVAESVAIRYAVRAPTQQWVRPPRVFVHTGEEVAEVTGWPEWMDARTLALVAEVHGQGMEFTVPDLSGWAFGEAGRHVTGWFEPSAVKMIEVRFDPNARGMALRATTGEQEWPCVPAADEEQKLQLAVTEAVRKGWEADGKLAITCKQQGMDDMRVVLGAPPKQLDLPEGEATVVIVQRHTEPIPGAGGYVRLHIDDITGGQTLLTLMAADGRELVKRKSVRDGETVRFQLGESEYELTMTKLVNLLLGDDYAEFVVKPHIEPDEAP